jgi:hypothetical protein
VPARGCTLFWSAAGMPPTSWIATGRGRSTWMPWPQQGESPGAVSEVSLDAAGLPHTLHVLEGIAAEGKGWVEQQELRTGNLSAAVNDPE